MAPTSQSQDAVYSHGHHSSVLRSHSWRTAQNSAAYLLPHLNPTDTFLDIGCGPGTITLDFGDLVPEGRVLGIDASADVIAQASASAKERNTTNFSFAVADLRDLPPSPEITEQGGFSVVHCHQVIQHCGDRVGVLKAMRKATKEGGIVAAREADFGSFTWYPANAGLDEWMALYLKFTRSNGGEPFAGRQLHAYAREAGFAPKDIIRTAGTWCYSTEAERQWWASMWADRTIHSEFARGTLAKGFATQEDLERISNAWRAWGEEEDGWFALMHGEIVAKKVGGDKE